MCVFFNVKKNCKLNKGFFLVNLIYINVYV